MTSEADRTATPEITLTVAQIQHLARLADATKFAGSLTIGSPELRALCALALKAKDMEPRPPIQKPRRKIVLLGKFEADDWDALAATFRSLEFEASREGGLSTRSVSGGYSSGHIYVCDVDGNMTHDKWAEELDAYLTSLPEPKA